jgi:uncharacterized membrane protein
MKRDKKVIWLFVLSLMGVLFSGYLSGVKFFTETCAFNESCPYFLGYPACYFGFAMFLTLFIFSTLLMYSSFNKKSGLLVLNVVSFMGILFAGYFTLGELPVLFEEGLSAYVTGLPTCAMGMIFFLTVFIISLVASVKERQVLTPNTNL